MTRRLVVEADGGSRGNPGVAGYGALVRDADGTLLAERAAPLGRASNNVAEYTGLVEGLLAAEQVDPGADVHVRMDSKLVVEQMAGRWKIKHEDMRRLALKAREVVRRIEAAGGSVSYQWIPRAENGAADKLSNDGMDGTTIERDRWRDGASSGAPTGGPSAGGPGADEVDEQLVLSTDQSPAAPPDVGRPTRVLLVRHGVTEFTVTARLDGRGGADPDLNDEGRAQAERAAHAVLHRLGGEGDGVHVVTSSLARARQTGAAVARLLGVDPRVDADWDEQCFGDWDGLSIKEIGQRWPLRLRRLRDDDDFAVPGGGESHRELAARVVPALRRAVELAGSGGTVVVVTHRKPIMVVLSDLLQVSGAMAWRLAAAPASVTGLEIWQDGNAQVAFTNDTHDYRSV